jgi:peptide/nickel transport system permease protein
MVEVIAGVLPAAAIGGLWREAAVRLRRNRLAMLGAFFIVLFVLMALLAPALAPYPPNAGSLADSLQPPSLAHLMGTDIQGRDEFSRVLYGARLSLAVGFAAVAIAVLLGGVIGAIAGGAGGAVDAILMRTVDVFLAIPGILLAIGIVAFLDRGLLQVTFAVAIANAPIFARLLRGSLIAVRETDYVLAARAVGLSRLRILLRHMLPNAMTPVIVAATLAFGTAIIDVAGLGFLGLGPPDPRTAEWGTMLQDSTRFLRSAQYLIFFPGAAIMISVIGFTLLGDGLREAIDPKANKRP